MLLLLNSSFDFTHLLYTLIEFISLSETEREKFIRTFVMGRYHQEIVMGCKKIHLLCIWFSYLLELWILVDRLTFKNYLRYEKSEAEWLFLIVNVSAYRCMNSFLCILIILLQSAFFCFKIFMRTFQKVKNTQLLPQLIHLRILLQAGHNQQAEKLWQTHCI